MIADVVDVTKRRRRRRRRRRFELKAIIKEYEFGRRLAPKVAKNSTLAAAK